MWDPFTLDALKTAFMAERETCKSVRGEQLDAREEADAKAAAEASE